MHNFAKIGVQHPKTAAQIVVLFVEMPTKMAALIDANIALEAYQESSSLICTIQFFNRFTVLSKPFRIDSLTDTQSFMGR
jgi:hypothetical protein